MNADLRYERSRYVMEHLAAVEALADRLKSAPMEVRRLGLPLAVAGWDGSPDAELVRLVADWLYGRWGLLPDRPVPQGAVALLRALEEDGVTAGPARSAAEREAEELLQAAKVLAVAANRLGGLRGA